MIMRMTTTVMMMTMMMKFDREVWNQEEILQFSSAIHIDNKEVSY